ncbi:MAG: type II toxin-antitoxin system MqsA family antitoxin [Thermodesulfobacteriota bacterium]
MRCLICKHGRTGSGGTVAMLHRGETIVIIKEVPAQVCDTCGEYYLDADTTGKVLAMAEAAANRHVEVEILRFAA